MHLTGRYADVFIIPIGSSNLALTQFHVVDRSS